MEEHLHYTMKQFRFDDLDRGVQELIKQGYRVHSFHVVNANSGDVPNIIYHVLFTTFK